MLLRIKTILKTLILFSFFFLASFLVFNLLLNLEVLGQTGSVDGTVQVAICGNDLKEVFEQCDGPDIGGKICETLGFDGGTLECLPSCQFDTFSCGSAAEDFDEVVFAKSSGGTLELTNPESTGSVIEILVNAFSTDLSLFAFSRLSEDVSVDKPAPSGKSFVGNVYDFLLFDEHGERVRTLLNSSDISITYLDSDVAEGFEESKIKPFHYNEEDSTWYLIPGSTLNTSLNSITFDTTSFSLFALFSEPPDPIPPEEPPPSGGSGGSGSGGFVRLPPFFQKPVVPIQKNPDFNDDGRVDISDLSILLYWWGKSGPGIASYDLNNDGIIDIVDASILFYHWTG